MRILLALGCALLLAPAAPAAPQKAAPTEKVICKRVYEADTGSHFQSSKRICRPASDWEQIDRETQGVMRSVRDNTALNPNATTQGAASEPQ